ncbi:MAG: 4-hydroxy-tetrahydrodipicolinate reductase [Candidatus Omnitrophota bacterium]
MLRIGISGIAGKMGKRIADLASGDESIKIVSATEKDGNPVVGKEEYGVKVTSDTEGACRGIDCLIEFTLPEATLEHLEVCRKNGVPMVIGTTGIDEAGEEKIKEASKTIPIVFSPNMAAGVNLLFNIVKETARVLGKDFDIKIDETHHVHKKDSPSGTAKMIARKIKEASGVDTPIEAFREGEVIGNHGIIFDGKYEQLEIRHDAKSRDVFAAGALKAAEFVAGKDPGLYSMADVLGLK